MCRCPRGVRGSSVLAWVAADLLLAAATDAVTGCFSPAGLIVAWSREAAEVAPLKAAASRSWGVPFARSGPLQPCRRTTSFWLHFNSALGGGFPAVHPGCCCTAVLSALPLFPTNFFHSPRQVALAKLLLIIDFLPNHKTLDKNS